MSPLEDTIVALRPITPRVPFALPNSIRPLNPAMPLGSTEGFSQIDTTDGGDLVPPQTNQMVNFGHEYVWHCHILSHEENDMMRVISLSGVSAHSVGAQPPLGSRGRERRHSRLDRSDACGAPQTWATRPMRSGSGSNGPRRARTPCLPNSRSPLRTRPATRTHRERRFIPLSGRRLQRSRPVHLEHRHRGGSGGHRDRHKRHL